MKQIIIGSLLILISAGNCFGEMYVYLDNHCIKHYTTLKENSEYRTFLNNSYGEFNLYHNAPFGLEWGMTIDEVRQLIYPNKLICINKPKRIYGTNKLPIMPVYESSVALYFSESYGLQEIWLNSKEINNDIVSLIDLYSHYSIALSDKYEYIGINKVGKINMRRYIDNLSSMSFSSGDARYSCLTLINTLFKLIKYSSNNGY